ncbi:MAG TPA: serine/threonine-protein kinase [Kofleriaceae bacterium]|nr:serine/threonine-protein kinase [Kofleriaceae bacterium]
MTGNPLQPLHFGRYRVTSKLGSGAMGEVLLARDELLDREVALKTLTAECVPDPSGRRPAEERFLMEARAAASIDHPNVVRLFDAGRAGGVPFLVMEAVRGPSLAARLDRALLSPAEVRSLGIQMGRALEAAHARGIVHRDLKPTNILEAEPGVWKLADFGIARLPYSTLTQTGTFVGTPAYAAPESILRGIFTTASDVYGLSATLYEALCGTPPHGLVGGRTMVARAGAAVIPPRQVRGNVPAELEAAILAALSRDPEKRPSAARLVELLAAGPRRRRPRRRLLAISLAAGAALLALALAGDDAPAGRPGAFAAAAGDAEMWFPPEPIGAIR